MLTAGTGAAGALLFRAGFAADRPSRAWTLGQATAPGLNEQRLEGLVGLAFGAAHQEVTVFDPVTLQPLETRALGAVVTWLSNEQRFWDGQFIWTYDLPANQVQAIAVDPRALTIARRVSTGGRGPAHSLVLTPDRTTAWVNVAGDNSLAAIDLAADEVVARVPTGQFP